jgi:hypothetical protein
MSGWMKRRIRRSRARCHKTLVAHRQTAARREGEAKPQHETETTLRAASQTARSK